MIETIIFDFGGVLFYSPWTGKRPSQEEVDRLKTPAVEILQENWPAKEKLSRDKFGQALLKSKKYKSIREIEAVLNSLFNINREVLNLIEQLWANGLKIYSLNNERPLWTDFRRFCFSLDDYFEGYFVSCETGLEKPDIESFANVLRHVKCSSNECLFIDDKKANIASAKRLGFATHQFKNARRLENELKKLGLIA